ncbi:hypothetical protein L873DRAFT_1287887 [Choiromyces venosus 120613-1]|uniref:Uncharacterized protein n=1 Tax=Choiromyces venosus 120613-1 TaxID=1336337 RepID=A0A3N4JCD5_9PEZI|nr:hypothetical protein L873DRAFT_1287887 [Choiromyces venosus 120613-1]
MFGFSMTTDLLYSKYIINVRYLYAQASIPGVCLRWRSGWITQQVSIQCRVVEMGVDPVLSKRLMDLMLGNII